MLAEMKHWKSQVLNFSTLSQAERAQKNGVSIPTQFKLDYLAGHRDDLLAAVQAGTLSIDKAYRLATGKVPETPLEALHRAWQRASLADRQQFLREVHAAARAAGLVQHRRSTPALPDARHPDPPAV